MDETFLSLLEVPVTGCYTFLRKQVPDIFIPAIIQPEIKH